MRLECKEVYVAYPGAERPVIEGLSFGIEAGEKVALLGLNGSGKTTLLKSIVGLLAYKGEIAVDGLRVASNSLAQVRRQVGFLFNVPEDQLLFPRVIDDVAFSLRQRKVPKSEAFKRARASLAGMGIERLAERPVYELSHGQKLRVALAGILVTEPELLLLDEPTAGLDPPGKRKLAELLQNLDASMLIATHDIDFARLVCSRALHIEGGAGGIARTYKSFEEVLQSWS